MEYGQHTDRELWLWYVRPAWERSERIKAAGKPPVFEPQTPEEEHAALSMLMMSVPGNVVTRAEWDARQEAEACRIGETRRPPP